MKLTFLNFVFKDGYFVIQICSYTGLPTKDETVKTTCDSKLNLFEVIMQGKYLLYCSVLSLGGNVNTRRMSQPDMGSIFHIKKSMKYSGQRRLFCELS